MLQNNKNKRIEHSSIQFEHTIFKYISKLYEAFTVLVSNNLDNTRFKENMGGGSLIFIYLVCWVAREYWGGAQALYGGVPHPLRPLQHSPQPVQGG